LSVKSQNRLLISIKQTILTMTMESINDWEFMTADPEWTPEPVRTYADVARNALVVAIDVGLFTLNVTSVLLNVSGHLVEGGKMLNATLKSSGTSVRTYLAKEEEKCSNACNCVNCAKK